MQRACVISLLCLSTMLVGASVSAGPLALNQQPTFPANAPSAALRPVAAQGQYGGGFLEFLVRGVQPSRGGYDQSPSAATYRPYPADLGPGMVESPTQPGYLVMDPRFLKQEVLYRGSETPGTIIINTNERMLYLVQEHGRALRYGIGVGRPG